MAQLKRWAVVLVVLLLLIPAVSLATTRTVGSGMTYSTVSAAYSAASPGDSITVYGGTYALDPFTISKANLHFRGYSSTGTASPKPIVDGQNDQVNGITNVSSGGKGIWTFTTGAGGCTVDNFEFKRAANASANGSGIRCDPFTGSFSVYNSYFHDCQMEFLGNPQTLLIDHCELYHSTHTEVGCEAQPICYEHCIYINSSNCQSATMQYSYFHQADQGNDIKSRAQNTFILYCRVEDQEGETVGPGLSIDIPDCGRGYIIGCVIEQSLSSPNFTIVKYGAESASNVTQDFYVINNTILNRNTTGTFVNARTGTTVKAYNNLMCGPGVNFSGGTFTLASNLLVSSLSTPNFVNSGDETAEDLHLTSSTPSTIIGVGTAPGLSATNYALTPTHQYHYDSAEEGRPTVGVIDIGAYEYNAGPDSVFSYFFPQAGPTTAPLDGAQAIAYAVTCPNNDLLTNGARIKVVVLNSTGAPIPGIPATSIYAQINGGPAAQGFSGAGDDTLKASSIWAPLAQCPDLRFIYADNATDATGAAYIYWKGRAGVRDANRKWGAWAGDIPIYVQGVHLSGRLTASSSNGTYTAHVKNVDFIGSNVVNAGEVVNSLDLAPVQNDAGGGGSYSYNEDFNNDGVVDESDLVIMRAHIQHRCNYPLNP